MRRSANQLPLLRQQQQQQRQWQQEPIESRQPRGGVIIHDLCTDNVLLVQGRMSKRWGFPKGHPEPGEQPSDTAARELREETGIQLDPAFLARCPMWRCGNQTYFICHTRAIDVPKFQPSDSHEIIDIAWWPPMQLAFLARENMNRAVYKFLVRYIREHCRLAQTTATATRLCAQAS
jgi:8-oxo-dGTP pyrophosphatase MutT (NUDIX family)